MVRITMPAPIPPLQPTRRSVLAGLGAATLLPGTAVAQAGRTQRALRLQDVPMRLRQAQPETTAWRFTPNMDKTNWSFRRGDTLELDLTNAATSAVQLNWYGLDGVASAVPLLGEGNIAAGGRATRVIPLRAAGTHFFETRIGNESAVRPLPCGVFTVNEASPPEVDRDDVLLFEDWRLKADGTALSPGTAAEQTQTVYTVNGRLDWTIPVRSNQRLRLRFVNGCHRTPVALRIPDHDVRVMAIDGQPAEPFPARDGRLILSPGSRIDTIIDATLPPASQTQVVLHDGSAPKPMVTLSYSPDPPQRAVPLPPAAALQGNDLPAQIPFQNAQRFDVAIGAPDADWVAAERLTTQAPPAFRARRGRAVVLAIANRAAMPVTFHLHGHHFRLLDRLDDGWKPFWLDTLLFDVGQTQRIAFMAEHAGNWPMETMGIEWSAPRLTRWFAVE
jgi:FtsP/CotA-like multicopper oxidase with cupredoxin domain